MPLQVGAPGRASQGVMLASRLRDEGYSVTIHDPVAASAAARALGPDVAAADSAEEALRDCDIGVIATPWPEYSRLGQLTLSQAVPVIDCWRILGSKPEGTLEIIWIGYGERRAMTAGFQTEAAT